jgi:autotransporter-associated beta strand protein
MKASPIALLLIAGSAFAGSATWNLDPVDNDWNNPANWTPATVPNGPTDVATFASSTITEVSLSANVELDRVVFEPGANVFTIETGHSLRLTISGLGIVNNSGVTQNFAVTIDPSTGIGNETKLLFTGSASVGNLVQLASGGGSGGGAGSQIEFHDDSSVLGAIITTQGGAQNSAGGATNFFDNSSVTNATVINDGGVDPNTGFGGGGGRTLFAGNSTALGTNFTNRAGIGVIAGGGSVTFDDNSSAPDAIIVCEGAANFGFGGSAIFAGEVNAGDALITLENGSDGRGGLASFLDNSTAGNATIFANAGTNGTSGFIAIPGGDGGLARFILRHGAVLSAFTNPRGEINLGSLEGHGLMWIGSNLMRIGTNNGSTLFDGEIREKAFASHGSISKVGTGTLDLGGNNTYTGVTTVEAGILLINNLQGSGTGTGPVQVTGGTLGGSGFIDGEVQVGLGSPGAFLAPGSSADSIGTLTIRSKLTFTAQSTYKVQIDSDRRAADKVIGRGVIIETGALIEFEDLGSRTLQIGSVFAIIASRGGAPLFTIFANLDEGEIVTIGVNKFQASYHGADGNSLTLTVVP